MRSYDELPELLPKLRDPNAEPGTSRTWVYTQRRPDRCVCGHAFSSHRADPNEADPYVEKRCKTCGCAEFDDGRPSDDDDDEEEAAR